MTDQYPRIIRAHFEQRIGPIIRFAILAFLMPISVTQALGQDCPVKIPIDEKVYKSEWIQTSSDLKGRVSSIREYELYTRSNIVPNKIGNRDFEVYEFRSFDRSGRLRLEYLRYPGLGRSPQSMCRFVYDDDGNGFTRLDYYYRDSSRLEWANKITFDAKGRIKTYIRQGVADSSWQDVHYSYTDRGQQLRRGESSTGSERKCRFFPDRNTVVEYWYQDEKFKDSTIFEYDTLGCLIRREAQPSSNFTGSAYIMEFDKDKIFERFSMPTDRLVSLDVYDREGRILESSEYHENGEIESRIEYTYDESGNLIKEWDRVGKEFKKISYEYDSRGNWILKRVREKSTNETIEVFYREIEYFD